MSFDNIFRPEQDQTDPMSLEKQIPMTGDYPQTEEPPETPTMVIIIICFVFTFAGFACYCCRFRGKTFVEHFLEARQTSDLEYARRVLERRQSKEESEKESPKERKKKLVSCFERNKVTMVVKEEDLQDDPDAEQDIGVEIGQTNSAGDQSLASQNASGSLLLTCGRSIPNCCAVCLSSYEVDDNVVWSCNPMCQHAFHQECVLEWLIKMQDGTPCPCCRQEFTDLESQEETPKDVEGSSVRSFNLAAVSF
mmetsp:Transcript_10606/g.19337  ORF Transcript_10606/g.19337 Transcript_10606/m.19337 type:complete len:251 (+) Transcript_10606:591-1343(+)